MPQVPEFRQRTQGTSTQLALENPRAARQRGQEFSAFAQQASNLASTVSQFEQASRNADNSLKFYEKQNQLKRNNALAEDHARRNAKADGSDLNALYEARSTELNKNLLSEDDDEDVTRRLRISAGDIAAKTTTNLLASARNLFTVDAGIRMERQRNQFSNNAFNNPDLAVNEMMDAEVFVEEATQKQMIGRDQRGAVLKDIRAGISKSTIYGFMDAGKFDKAREAVNSFGANLSPDQRQNFRNLINAKKIEQSNLEFTKKQRARKIKEQQLADTQEKNVNNLISLYASAAENPNAQKELAKKSVKLLAEQGIDTDGYFLVNRVMSVTQKNKDQDASFDSLIQIAEADNEPKLNSIRTNALMDLGHKRISVETFDRIDREVQQRKRAILNDPARARLAKEGNAIINAALQFNPITGRFLKKEGKKLYAAVLGRRNELISEGKDPKVASVEAVNEIIGFDESIPPIPQISPALQKSLSTLRKLKPILKRKAERNGFHKDPVKNKEIYLKSLKTLKQKIEALERKEQTREQLKQQQGSNGR